MKEISRSGRLGASRAVLRLASHLTDRDRRIAWDCFEFRVMTSSEITRLHFTGTRTTAARLDVLYRLRVLDHFRPSLPMGQGTAPYHWIIDEAGALIVADHLDIERAKLGWQHSIAASIAHSQKLPHHVEVDEFFTRMAVEANVAGGALSSGTASEPATTSSPATSWPTAMAFLISRAARFCIPVVELDRGTETTGRLRDKAKAYTSILPTSSLGKLDPFVLLLVQARGAQKPPGRRCVQRRADRCDGMEQGQHRPVLTLVVNARERLRQSQHAAAREGLRSGAGSDLHPPRGRRRRAIGGRRHDPRVCLHPHLHRRGEPANLARFPARTARGVLQGAGGLAGHRHDEDRTTGTKLDRPGLQAALDLARLGRIDQLLVYRIDRLSRKVRQLASIAEELDTLNVILRSATEPFDTASPAGRMMLQMLGVFAEFEHATIVDRITAGIERRAREGRWYSGRPPFGYTLKDGQLTPDPITAPTVRRI